MNGIHDMGGMHGFGPIEAESDEPVFHARWEARVFGMSALAGRRLGSNIDARRHALERLDPVSYLRDGYYGRWLARLERSLLEGGVLGPGELEARIAGGRVPAAALPSLPQAGRLESRPARSEAKSAEPSEGHQQAGRLESRPARSEAKSAEPSEGHQQAGRLESRPARSEAKSAEPSEGHQLATPAPHPFFRSIDRAARYSVGDRVRTRNHQPAGHTRLAGYARSRRGVVARVYPPCVFPDTNAHAQGEHPQHVYAVRFEARELWGEGAEPGTCVHLDCFEPYLEPDPGR